MNRARSSARSSAAGHAGGAAARAAARAGGFRAASARVRPGRAAAVEHQDADAFVEYLLRAQEPPEGGDVAIEPEELYTGDPDPEEAGLGDVLGSAALPDWLSDLPADGDLGAMQVHLQEKLSSDLDLLALLDEEDPAVVEAIFDDDAMVFLVESSAASADGADVGGAAACAGAAYDEPGGADGGARAAAPPERGRCSPGIFPTLTVGRYAEPRSWRRQQHRHRLVVRLGGRRAGRRAVAGRDARGLPSAAAP